MSAFFREREGVLLVQLWHLLKEADPILQKERDPLSFPCLLSFFLSLTLSYHSLLIFWGSFLLLYFFGLGRRGIESESE